ncbi:hypothetical protein ACN5ZK_05890 [Macrococcoides bohemicum]|nr:hypothetical protein [Macrococcus sp. IME1552]ATD31209.1 hypothetical protein BHM04_08440 [Macrococcus sp. IME1552]
MVQLVPYEEQYKERLKQFYQPAEALKYTQLPEYSIEEINDNVHGVVIINQNQTIGFFLLHRTDRRFQYTDDNQPLLLTNLIMDHSYSGKGHGKQYIYKLEIYKD